MGQYGIFYNKMRNNNLSRNVYFRADRLFSGYLYMGWSEVFPPSLMKTEMMPLA